MAWYAELKRRNLENWLINGFSANYAFKKKLREDRQAAYQAWYNSLTEEQRQELREKERIQKENAEKDVETAIQLMNFFTKCFYYYLHK